MKNESIRILTDLKIVLMYLSLKDFFFLRFPKFSLLLLHITGKS